jgi:hypothetical protein
MTGEEFLARGRPLRARQIELRDRIRVLSKRPDGPGSPALLKALEEYSSVTAAVADHMRKYGAGE